MEMSRAAGPSDSLSWDIPLPTAPCLPSRLQAQQSFCGRPAQGVTQVSSDPLQARGQRGLGIELPSA